MKEYGSGAFDPSITVAPGKSLRIERDVIAVDMMSPVEPDPDWAFTDAAGHEHRWVDGQLVTIAYVETDRWWCSDCREEHLETEPRCKQCGQKIEPGYRAAPNPQYITGAVHYYLDDVELTPEQVAAMKLGKPMRFDDEGTLLE